MPQKKLHDFSGDAKTRDTYDKDWVFHNGAWVTKRQRRSAVAGQKQARRYNRAIRAKKQPGGAVNAPPGPPSTAPIIGDYSGGGAGAASTDLFGVGNKPAIVDSQQPGVPSWWINAAIKNPKDPNAEFANAANALLPTLSPEDQRSLANYLATNYRDVYGGYANANFGPIPTEITAETRKQFLSPQRAQMALNLLEQMKTASGAQTMGAGYDFLKNAVNLMSQFASTGTMTREKYQQFQNAVSAMQKNAGQGLGAYANLAQLFNLPSFTAGSLVSNTPNPKLFT